MLHPLQKQKLGVRVPPGRPTKAGERDHPLAGMRKPAQGSKALIAAGFLATRSGVLVRDSKAHGERKWLKARLTYLQMSVQSTKPR